MELHVWGQGFDLPSIDPECLAAITFFSIYVKPEKWRLVQSSDPSVSPNRTLPALSHNSRWISGYDDIIRHATTSNDVLVKSVPCLAPIQKAHLIAYTAFIRKHGAPLISLSLYVSSANWVGSTRPLYSKILRFPLPWTVPLFLRSRAHSTAAHLSLSSLDTDYVSPKEKDGSNRQQPAAAADVFNRNPTLESLRTRMHAVTGSLTPDVRSHIRLDGLASDFYAPLEALLRETNMGKTFIQTGGQPTALDCLCYGYLALMLFPELPRRFLADSMNRKHKELVRFTVMMRNLSRKNGDLRVSNSEDGMGGTLARFMDSVADKMPGGLGDAWQRWKRLAAEGKLAGNSVVGWEAYDVLHLAAQILGATLVGLTAAAYKGMLGLGPGPGGHKAWERQILGLGGKGEAGKMFDMAFEAL
ncbi:hypothetical protein MKZ38_007303 [Zalerion maritima]|uniref:Mitochondrial outer membrane transport complex Sam37/metaxin N-terminal domain-containing protein n=1 Tax=Zalerion maritima TaxID=339359 RepID=A0AAD5RHV3_9PEZI|nr:hypothetical protein MKZ38_007303 [Zalerion maritima]